LQISRRESAWASWQNSIETNCVQQPNPLAHRFVLFSLTSAPNETGAKRGLRCFHGWIPSLESAVQFVIKHMGADLKKQMGAGFGPAHLL